MRLDSACVCYDGGGVPTPTGLSPLTFPPGLVGRAVVFRSFLAARPFFAGSRAVSQCPKCHCSAIQGHCGNRYGSRRFALQCRSGTFILCPGVFCGILVLDLGRYLVLYFQSLLSPEVFHTLLAPRELRIQKKQCS